jgi:hypothetical protein
MFLKSIDGCKEDLQFSDNMTAFVPNGAVRSFGRNSVNGGIFAASRPR